MEQELIRPIEYWNPQEIELLKNNYKELGPQGFTNILNRTPKAIHRRAIRLGLKCKLLKPLKHCVDCNKELKMRYGKTIRCRSCSKIYSFSVSNNKRFWKAKDIQFIKNNFYELNIEEMANILNRSPKSVIHKCTKMRLLLMKSPHRKQKRAVVYNGKHFKDNEIQFIKQYYCTSSREFMLNNLDRTWNSISHKGLRLGLIRDDKFLKEAHAKSLIWLRKNNPMYNPLIIKKVKETLKKLYEEHPEKLRNATMRRNRMTKIELKMSKILEELNLQYKWNQYVKTSSGWKFPDFLIGNIIIECDGKYWHKDIEADKKREKELIDADYMIIRFNDDDILKNRDKTKLTISNIFAKKQEVN